VSGIERIARTWRSIAYLSNPDCPNAYTWIATSAWLELECRRLSHPLLRFLQVMGVEHSVRTFKHEWLLRFMLETIVDCDAALDGFAHYHNTPRLQLGRACKGYTPKPFLPCPSCHAYRNPSYPIDGSPATTSVFSAHSTIQLSTLYNEARDCFTHESITLNPLLIASLCKYPYG
jgi:hypothetical protein